MTSDVCATDFSDVDVVLLFHSVPERTGWFWKLLQPGFGHVQVWMLANGKWIQLDGCLEALFVKTYDTPPWELVNEKYAPTFVGIRRKVKTNRVREPFHVGPITCVDLAKAVLGIRAPFVRTPYQLYKGILKGKWLT